MVTLFLVLILSLSLLCAILTLGLVLRVLCLLVSCDILPGGLRLLVWSLPIDLSLPVWSLCSEYSPMLTSDGIISSGFLAAIKAASFALFLGLRDPLSTRDDPMNWSKAWADSAWSYSRDCKPGRPVGLTTVDGMNNVSDLPVVMGKWRNLAVEMQKRETPKRRANGKAVILAYYGSTPVMDYFLLLCSNSIHPTNWVHNTSQSKG